MTDAAHEKDAETVPDVDVDVDEMETDVLESDEAGSGEAASDDAETDEAASAETAAAPTLNPRKKAKAAPPVDPGETLLYEPGGSWWVVAIGPILILATLIMEIIGKGRIHWEVLSIFGVVLVGFSVLQVVAARQHVSMELTETTLRQGTETIEIADIVKIFPENHGTETQDWEGAPALGELHAVPRRRKGVGVRLADGRLGQAWARDVGRLRTELTEAHLAATLGLPPKGKR